MQRRCFVFIALFGVVGCLKTGRTSIPYEESHYEREVAHELAPEVAFERVEGALARSYQDWPRLLETKDRKEGQLLLKPKVSYRTGGPMGTVHHAPYTLAITVRKGTISLAFDLQKDPASDQWAPTEAIPYIRHDFDAVVSNVEDAVAPR